MRRMLVPVSVALAVGVMLAGCAKQADPAPEVKETARAGLSLGWTPGPASPQIPVAQKQGLWAAEGLDVKVNKFTSGREALESLLGGGLDVAVLAEFPVVTAALNKRDVVIVDSLSRYRKYRLIGRKDRGVTDLKSLGSKKIATTLGTNMQFVTNELLDSVKVSAEIVNVAPPDVVAALSRGDVDAAVMFESFYPGAKKALGDKYIEIPIDPATYTGNMVVAVSQKTIDSRPRDVQSLVNGLVKAARITSSDAEGSRRALLDSLGGVITAEYLASVWSDYDYSAVLSDDVRALMVREGLWVQEQGTAGAGLTIDAAFFAPHINSTFLDNVPKN